MSGTKKLFNVIQSGTALHYQNITDLDVEELVHLLGSRIVRTGGRDYGHDYRIAMHREDPTDCSDRTEYFDWHSDGLYYSKPPKYVLLHCLDPGSQQINTDLAETIQVLSVIHHDHFQILKKLLSHYIGHGGNFDHPVLTGYQNSEMLLASRGHISALPDLSLEDHPSLREISTALTDLYRSLDENAVSYQWNKGATLIFNQYQYMHRRNSNSIDRERKLIRMWFN